VEAYADRASGIEASERLFVQRRRSERNIAVMFMVDMSGSTKGWINACEREALVLLCEALEALGDRYAIYGFSGWTRKRRAWAGTDRGIGLALFCHGGGFTGSGEVRLASRATLETTARGVRVLVAATEMGQGAHTVLAQVVAEALGVPLEDVAVAAPDTGLVPNSGPTVASRTSMVVGRILERGARALRERLGGLSPAEHFRRHGPLRETTAYEPPPGVTWDDATCRARCAKVMRSSSPASSTTTRGRPGP